MRELFRTIRVLRDGPLPGVRNMALDEALMRSAASAGGVTLRLYEWAPGCLSFGRNQRARGAYDPVAVADRGYDVVRRPTGGRAVLHHRELTYSVTAPADAWGSLRAAYARINRALAAGLAELGVDARCAPAPDPGRRAPAPSARACFADPLPGEVTARGRKLIGSAQWRNGGALLQHGSLLLVDEQSVVGSLRMPRPAGVTRRRAAAPASSGASPRTDAPASSVPASTASDELSGSIGLAELLPELPTPTELAGALVAGFARELGVRPAPGGLCAEEGALAEQVEARYADPEWTWRR